MNHSTPTSSSSSHRWLYGITNWYLFISGIINIGAGTWFAINQNLTAAATLLGAGLILLFAATIDRFESLKGLGIEAKTRQLDKKIEQADDALRRLKELAELTGTTLVDLNSKMGRWNSVPTSREAYGLAQKVHSIMRNLGSDQRAIKVALNPWIHTMCRDLAAALVSPLHVLINKEISEAESHRSVIKQPIKPDDPEYLRLTSLVHVAGAFDKQLRNIWQFEVDDFPDRFIQLFDDVPLIPAGVLAPIRNKALEFAATMTELKERLRLSDPERWFAEIEGYREQLQRS